MQTLSKETLNRTFLLWYRLTQTIISWTENKANHYREGGFEIIVISIIIIFCEFLLRFSPRIINGLRSYIKHSKRVFYSISKHLASWGAGIDGAVVRALASHQCGPGLIPGLGVICGLSLLLVLVFALRGFSPGTSVFPSPQKPTFLNSNSIWKVSPISALH